MKTLKLAFVSLLTLSAACDGTPFVAATSDEGGTSEGAAPADDIDAGGTAHEGGLTSTSKDSGEDAAPVEAGPEGNVPHDAGSPPPVDAGLLLKACVASVGGHVQNITCPPFESFCSGGQICEIAWGAGDQNYCTTFKSQQPTWTLQPCVSQEPCVVTTGIGMVQGTCL